MANNEELKEVVNTSEQTETSKTSEATNDSPQETAGEQEVEEVDDNDIEFDDSDTADDEEPSSNTKKPPNKREINREKAKQRREQRDKELHNSYLKGVKAATGEVNPYTQIKMETDEDVQDYLDMKEMESKGLDPTDSKDYIKFIREKQKAQMAENEAKEQATNKYQKELLEFKTKYNDVDIEELVNKDKSWASLIIPQIQQGKTLLQAYESVNSLINKSVNERANTLADEKAKKQMQNSFASAGSQTIGEEQEQPKVDYSKMSDDEFNEFWRKRKSQ